MTKWHRATLALTLLLSLSSFSSTGSLRAQSTYSGSVTEYSGIELKAQKPVADAANRASLSSDKAAASQSNQDTGNSAKSSSQSNAPSSSVALQGYVAKNYDHIKPVDGLFDKVKTAEDEAAAAVKAPVVKGVPGKVAAKGKSLANYVFALRGFDWSKEGANASLNEHVVPKSEDARELLKRQAKDEVRLSFASDIMQLGVVLGSPSDAQGRHRSMDASYASLEKLIGSEQARALLNQMRTAKQSLSSKSLHDRTDWDIEQRNNTLKSIIDTAWAADPVVKDLNLKLHKYNNRSKFMQVSAKVVYSTLGIASFSPTLVAPIAGITETTFMMLSGGPEQDKLLREIYLTKQLESRLHVINEEAHLVVDGYQMAVNHSNPLLLACSKSLLKDMTGEPGIGRLLAAAASHQSESEAALTDDASAPQKHWHPQSEVTATAPDLVPEVKTPYVGRLSDLQPTATAPSTSTASAPAASTTQSAPSAPVQTATTQTQTASPQPTQAAATPQTAAQPPTINFDLDETNDQRQSYRVFQTVKNTRTPSPPARLAGKQDSGTL